MDAKKPDGTDSKQATEATSHTQSLDADVALLSHLLSQSSDPDNAEVNMEELLKSLDMADGIAGSVESRIDSLLGRLDDMLDGLEPTTSNAGEAVLCEAENQSHPNDVSPAADSKCEPAEGDGKG